MIIHKPFLGSRDVPQKFGPDRLGRFDVYWIQTNKQLQTSQIYKWIRKHLEHLIKNKIQKDEKTVIYFSKNLKKCIKARSNNILQ